ncbi:hypothetical protein GCM10009582_25830 [Arthrobacter flavus]
MPRGEVNDVQVLEVRNFGKQSMACAGQLQHLRARDRAAHQGGPDPTSGIVREFDGLAKHRAGLRDGTGPKTRKVLRAQPFEARLLCEELKRRQRKFRQLLRYAWCDRASHRHRAGIDPHHPMDKLGVSVKDEADRGVRPIVSDKCYGLIRRDPMFSDDVQYR